ncbi:MAG: HAD family phosphatase, partial [Patescibacteria group bacterium]|nr:HAD family phosphatase [Patescibacteria group bacterium]
MIKAIIFDFAGVIGAEGYWLWLTENIHNLESSKDFFLHLSNQVDRGDITDKEFISILAAHSRKSPDDIWPEIFEKIIINENLIATIKKLRGVYKIGLLTNFVNEWITEIINHHKLQNYFDHIVISSREKIIKPDAKIFLLMLDHLQIHPDEAIFIDDRQNNVDGANAVGMKG